jgi:TP901 family phage tail tape measure protein
MKLYADTARFVSGLVSAEGGVRKFTGGVKREFEALKGAMSSVEGKLASIGVSVGAVATIMQSARMDKSLTQIGQTAGASESDVAGLRKELFRMSSETGQNVEDLQQGFNNAVQAGLQFKEALPVIDATNKAMAVTGANADSLTGALTVAATAFNFDLSKPGVALTLLDKMTVAGRLGNAELEGLSSIFSRVGVNAAAAGFGFDKTLAFIEGLSQIERTPERLATLADSTLRLFTNANYMKEAAKATGVPFFDKKGAQRDGFEIFADIKKKYDALGTDKDRTMFMSRAFGKVDLDTVKGLRSLFNTDILGKMSGVFVDDIASAGDTLIHNLPDAISNAVDQTGRLKAALRTAADDFAKPINESLSGLIKWGMDKKENGGLGMDGKDMLIGAVVGGLGLFGAARYGGKAVGALSKRLGGTAAGVAEGKVLEQAAGVTPVFVVNMPGGGLAGGAGVSDVAAGAGGALAAKGAFAAKNLKTTAALLGGSNLTALRMMGVGALSTAGGATVAAGAAGYGVGTLGYKYGLEGNAGGNAIGAVIAKTLALFGNEEARRAVELTEKLKSAEIGGTITIKVDQEGRASVASVKPSQPSVRFNVHSGPYMMSQN